MVACETLNQELLFWLWHDSRLGRGQIFFFLIFSALFDYEQIEFRPWSLNDRTAVLHSSRERDRPRFSAPAGSILMTLFLIYYANQNFLILGQTTHVKPPSENFFRGLAFFVYQFPSFKNTSFLGWSFKIRLKTTNFWEICPLHMPSNP